MGITRILVMMSLAAAAPRSYFSHSSLLTSPHTFPTLKYVTLVQAAGHWSPHHTRLLVLVYTSWHQSTHLDTVHWRPTLGCCPAQHRLLPAGCLCLLRPRTLYTTVLYTVHCTPVHCTPGQLTPGACSHMGTLSPHSGALCYLVLQSPA